MHDLPDEKTRNHSPFTVVIRGQWAGAEPLPRHILVSLNFLQCLHVNSCIHNTDFRGKQGRPGARLHRAGLTLQASWTTPFNPAPQSWALRASEMGGGEGEEPRSDLLSGQNHPGSHEGVNWRQKTK